MSNERDGFLKALTDNEDDTTTRLIYADWLEERGEDDEAARQRAWPAAKAWLKDFTLSINYSGYARDENGDEALDADGECIRLPAVFGDPHFYADIIQAGHDMIRGDNACFGSDEGADFFREGGEQVRDFFRNWSIVTGEAAPEEVVDNPSVSCAC